MLAQIQPFFDTTSGIVSYVLSDGHDAAIIDSVLNFDVPGAQTMTQAAARDPQWESSVAQQRADNIHVYDGVSEVQFIAARESCDATLSPPRLILPALQVNIRAGSLPPPEDNGVAYLKIPVNAL